MNMETLTNDENRQLLSDYAKAIVAFDQGKKIETQFEKGGKWELWGCNNIPPEFGSYYGFRIAPEHPEPTYAPWGPEDVPFPCAVRHNVGLAPVTILTYWVAECLTDYNCYSIRRRTKKEVLKELELLPATLTRYPDEDPIYRTKWGTNFSEPRKVTVEHSDSFDLLCKCLGEGGIYEGGTNES